MLRSRPKCTGIPSNPPSLVKVGHNIKNFVVTCVVFPQPVFPRIRITELWKIVSIISSLIAWIGRAARFFLLSWRFLSFSNRFTHSSLRPYTMSHKSKPKKRKLSIKNYFTDLLQRCLRQKAFVNIAPYPWIPVSRRGGPWNHTARRDGRLW